MSSELISAQAPFLANGFHPVTLITGGSKGIGAGCAQTFAHAGARVVICDIDRQAGEELAERLSTGPGECVYETCDVNDADQIERVVRATIERYGQMDCLINNAMTFPARKPIDEISIQELEATLRVSIVHCFAACKFALPFLRATRGSIINMGSITGRDGQWHAASYCAAKAAIHGLTKALAIDEAANGVRVNAVLPGNILTTARERLEAGLEDPQTFHAWVESMQWMGRSGTIEEVANACLFLASPAASFITGIELIVSGGIELGHGPKTPFPQI